MVDGALFCYGLLVVCLLLQQNYSGGPQEDQRQIDGNAVINDALQVVQGSLQKRAITVKEDLESPEPLLFIDKGRFLQILLMLLKNSIEAFGAKLTAGLDDGKERRLFLLSRVCGNQFKVTIRDNAVGFNEGELDNLFVFGSSSKGASGFGLYHCKQWLEKMVVA